MTKIENKENVSQIIMKPTAIAKCKIGQDWYRMQFEVFFYPDDCYPDYMEVNQFILEEMDGKELNIEEATDMLYKMLLDYKPVMLKVTNHIIGCKTHFDVDVTIG